MAQAVQEFPAVDIGARFRRQAYWVWFVTSLVVLGWVLLIVGAPIAKTAGFTAFSHPLYTFFGYICHQISERSFHLEGVKFAVCARCFGVYFGLFAGIAAYPLWRRVEDVEPLPRIWLFLSLIPIGTDWALGVFGIWDNTHLSRFLTGMILGVACAVDIVPAIVEITRHLTAKKAIKTAA